MKLEKEMQEWMDKLNIFGIEMLNQIVRYKLREQAKRISKNLVHNPLGCPSCTFNREKLNRVINKLNKEGK